MYFLNRKTLCIVLLLSVSIVQVTASTNPLSLRIDTVDGSIEAFRYQIGTNTGENWIDVNSSAQVLVLNEFDDSKDMLYIQQTTDGITWSDSYGYRYNQYEQKWDLAPSEKVKSGNLDSLSINLHALYPQKNCSDYYSYLLGTGLQANFSFGKNKQVLAFGGLSYSNGPSNTDWVTAFNEIGLMAGFGYRIAVTERFHISAEVGYGLLMHLLDADLDEDGKNSFELFQDQQVRVSASLVYSFTDRYSVFLSPMGVAFFENDSVGTLFGCQAGLQLNL
jgi:hypothetical protein